VYAAGEREFLVIRFDPAAPRIVGRCEASKGVCGVSVNGKTACFGGPSVGLVDVSDPARPVILGQIAAQRHEGTYGGPDPLIISTHVFSRQGHEYVAAADHYWGLRLYDAADRRRPREIGDFPTSGGDFTGIQAEGRRVYVGNNWGGVYIADVSNPQRPRLIGGTRRMLQPNRGSAGLLAEDNRLFFQGNTNRTLYIADVTDAARPALLGQYCLPEQGREFGDNRRFGCTFPQRNGRRLYTPGFARVFDVSDPRGPRLVGECPEVGFANDVCALATIAGRDYLVIGEYYSGLTVLRLGEGGPAMGLGPSQAGRAN
jgi:hypothetical protein